MYAQYDYIIIALVFGDFFKKILKLYILHKFKLKIEQNFYVLKIKIFEKISKKYCKIK